MDFKYPANAGKKGKSTTDSNLILIVAGLDLFRQRGRRSPVVPMNTSKNKFDFDIPPFFQSCRSVSGDAVSVYGVIQTNDEY